MAAQDSARDPRTHAPGLPAPSGAPRDRTEGLDCGRCGERRWPWGNPPLPYTCQRCLEFLAGDNALDPKPGPASPALLAAVARRRATL